VKGMGGAVKPRFPAKLVFWPVWHSEVRLASRIPPPTPWEHVGVGGAGMLRVSGLRAVLQAQLRGILAQPGEVPSRFRPGSIVPVWQQGSISPTFCDLIIVCNHPPVHPKSAGRGTHPLEARIQRCIRQAGQQLADVLLFS
jgi:hypothetical protein